jgi:hypothetical protein
MRSFVKKTSGKADGQAGAKEYDKQGTFRHVLDSSGGLSYPPSPEHLHTFADQE